MNTETPAMASIPIQQFGEIYDPKIALQSGTIFAELDLPFFSGGETNE